MSDQPRRPRTLNDARTEAEAAFKKTTTKVVQFLCLSHLAARDIVPLSQYGNILKIFGIKAASLSGQFSSKETCT